MVYLQHRGGFLQRLTVHDLIAGVIAAIALVGIVVLAALEKPSPQILDLVTIAAVAYFLRGAQNGGLLPGKPKPEA